LTGYILDAFAILVWILDQEGANAVQQLLEQASAGAISLTMSMINAGEVRYMLAKKKGAPAAEQYEQQMLSLPVRYVTPEAEDILAAARFKSNHAISYADAFAVALALELKAQLVTGDPELWSLRDIISLKWLGLPLE
jgi:uncharacterized protein